MTAIERAARWIKGTAGLGDSSAISVAVRPYYNRFLEIVYRERGLSRKMAGQQPMRIRPASRYYRDDFEAGLFRFLEGVVRPGDVVLEVGANIGIFTVLLGRWVGPRGHVYAFEPAPETRALLEDHLMLNGVQDRVTVVADAISDVPGRSSFHAAGMSGRNALSPNTHGERGPDTVEVPVTTIDAFCKERNVIPTLIKMDIEGYEIHALRGARDVIAKHAPALIVELHHLNWPEIGVSAGEMDEMLSRMESNYRVQSLEEDPDCMSPYGHVALLPRSRAQGPAPARNTPDVTDTADTSEFAAARVLANTTGAKPVSQESRWEHK